MNFKSLLILLCVILVCTGFVVAVDNPQGNNPVCEPCSSYGLGFNGPLEYTPYMEPLNDRSYQPGKIYVVYSVIPKEEDWWTESTGTWQAWGPYEFKAGKGYILEFGPQDIVGMTEGELPYYVEGTASWLQSLNTDYWDENAYAYCVVSEERFGQTGGSHETPTVMPEPVLDYTTTSEVVDYDPVDRKSTYSPDDARVYFWTEIGPVYGGEELEIQWKNPQGEIYYTSDITVSDPADSGYDYWEDYSLYSYIKIADWEPASNPGTWSVDLSMDGNYLLTDPFVIEGTGGVLQDLTYSPSNPKIMDEITFTLKVSGAPASPSYSWDMGEPSFDGQPVAWTETPSYTYQYYESGTYPVTVQLRDRDNYTSILDERTWNVRVQ